MKNRFPGVMALSAVVWCGLAGCTTTRPAANTTVGSTDSRLARVEDMLQRNELFYSFSYLFGTLVGGFACFYLGFMILRSLRAML